MNFLYFPKVSIIYLNRQGKSNERLQKLSLKITLKIITNFNEVYNAGCQNHRIYFFETKREVKFTVERRLRTACAAWLKLHIVKKESANMRKVGQESHLQIRCSNPTCNVKEFAESKFQTCTRCSFSRYCNRNCQADHYAEHKLHCERIAKILG